MIATARFRISVRWVISSLVVLGFAGLLSLHVVLWMITWGVPWLGGGGVSRPLATPPSEPMIIVVHYHTVGLRCLIHSVRSLWAVVCPVVLVVRYLWLVLCVVVAMCPTPWGLAVWSLHAVHIALGWGVPLLQIRHVRIVGQILLLLLVYCRVLHSTLILWWYSWNKDKNSPFMSTFIQSFAMCVLFSLSSTDCFTIKPLNITFFHLKGLVQDWSKLFTIFFLPLTSYISSTCLRPSKKQDNTFQTDCIGNRATLSTWRKGK